MLRISITHLRKVLTGFAMAAFLLATAACNGVVDAPPDDYEPVVGLEELLNLDGTWQGLEPQHEDDHSSPRRYIRLAVDDSLFYEVYHNADDCYLVTENTILEAEENQFPILMKNGDVRNVIFELNPETDHVRFVNHVGREYFFERSTKTLTDFTPECEVDTASASHSLVMP